jgi:hypothetical protein
MEAASVPMLLDKLGHLAVPAEIIPLFTLAVLLAPFEGRCTPT